jgi:hypothetical protein
MEKPSLIKNSQGGPRSQWLDLMRDDVKSVYHWGSSVSLNVVREELMAAHL